MNASSPAVVSNTSGIPGTPFAPGILDAEQKGFPHSATIPFSSVAAHIRKTLEPLSAANGTILAELEENVASMQDHFIDHVYATFNQHSITITEKITVGLDKHGNLTLLASHPQEETILSALAANPTLSTLFSEIAMQSFALRQLRSLYLLAAAHHERLTVMPAPLPSYQFSLKGDMNHFFFVPQG